MQLILERLVVSFGLRRRHDESGSATCRRGITVLRERIVGNDGYSVTFYIMLIIGIVGVIGFVVVAAGAS